MDTIISVQDIRTSLGTIARRAERGETFTVIRHSKPAFRIVPVVEAQSVHEPKTAYSSQVRDGYGAAGPTPTLAEIRARFAAMPVTEDDLTPAELDRIIHEVHAEANRKMRADADRAV